MWTPADPNPTPPRSGSASSTDPLQTAVARLVGYRWPALSDDDARPVPDALDAHADDDGIVSLVAVRGEASAEKRLRDGFFAQHLKRFNNRPFVWDIGEGTEYPWFSSLFDQNYFENPVDIFFNLFLFFLSSRWSLSTFLLRNRSV